MIDKLSWWYITFYPQHYIYSEFNYIIPYNSKCLFENWFKIIVFAESRFKNFFFTWLYMWYLNYGGRRCWPWLAIDGYQRNVNFALHSILMPRHIRLFCCGIRSRQQSLTTKEKRRIACRKNTTVQQFKI